MAATIAWLECKVSAGQFSEEFAVSACDHQGHAFSLFVNQAYVEFDRQAVAHGIDSDGRLKVVVLKEQQDLVLVKLPARTFENGSMVTVIRTQLDYSQSPSQISGPTA